MKRIILGLLIVFQGFSYADINNSKELNEKLEKQYEEFGCKDLKKVSDESDEVFNDRIEKCLTIGLLLGANTLKNEKDK